MRRSFLALASLGVLALAAPADAAQEARFAGRVQERGGAPVEGAMVTWLRGDPLHAVTVFTERDGRYRTPPLDGSERYTVRVRRIGWQDLRVEDLRAPARGEKRFDLVLQRERDPAALAEQLPANRWLALLLAKLPDPAEREEFVRQCTFCHQQGSAATRRQRDDEEWRKVLALMARMGGTLSPELRAKVPTLFGEAFAPEIAVPLLTAHAGDPGFAPPPPPEVRRAVVEEWEMGVPASMQHDVALHPDGRLYSVDMLQDKLYRLDPSDSTRASFAIPDAGLPLGGVFATANATSPAPPSSNAHVGPHSLQIAPDGAVWTTLALGNQLARFDPASERWTLHALAEGFYPHTLRFDAKGRIWYSIAVSNHLGRFDPATGEHVQIRLPARTWGQAFALRALPALLWLAKRVDVGETAMGEGVALPVPYGVDVAPDGGVWFSQLNEHRIGRVDPETLAVEMIDTPFPGPRRLRFDSKGQLWIPGFSGAVVARFDPRTREFRTFELPIEPRGTETPYALNVDRRTDTIWICGTNSDTLIRFEPESERFTVYPLPTRVTYTREIDFDAGGRVWTSNSNLPTWHVEGNYPRILRLDPRGDGAPDARLAAKEER
jgi:streptogramin lyase